MDIALSNLLHAYASIEAEKRPSRIRDFVHSVIVSQEDQESMSEMMDMFRAGDQLFSFFLLMLFRGSQEGAWPRNCAF